jgi:phage terminase large subunit-like protein
MLGLIVQNSSYDGWISEARTDPTKMPELIAKYFNHYVTGKVSDWVKPDRIRQMQTKRRIEDCEDTDGWDVYCGMDFSQGNDLHAATYLAVRWNEERQSLEYFADLDAWINEETLHSSSIRDLYEKWIAEGWLHVSEGGVFQPNLLTKRIRQLNDDYRINFRAFGYDAKLSHDPINELCAWLQTIGISDPSKIAVPVGQTNATFNQPVDRLTFLLKDTHTTLSFSPSPLWPWEFGNVALDQDLRMQNKKPIKRNGSDSCKVDNVQCLCMAFYLEEMFNT